MDGWSGGFFDVNEIGHVICKPTRDDQPALDLHEIVEGMVERGFSPPIILAFPDLLARRMADLRDAFRAAIKECEYRGDYAGLYPIKVNQQRFLVDQIERFGRDLDLGLEVGSKPELLAVLGMTCQTPERLIVCNGFKERRYVEHIMLATKLGRRVVSVIENLNELDLVIELAQAYDVRPIIGVRALISQVGPGRWGVSSGERAKFGLSAPGILRVVERLEQADLLDALQLIHCHMGSQLSDIRAINAGVNELARVYAELCKLGAPMRYIDVGGGMGIDYDGSQTAWDFSVNYTMEEYAANVVYRVMSVCDEAEVAHPTILTEAGRAMVAHHSVLVFNVLGANCTERHLPPDDFSLGDLSDEPPRPLEDLAEARDDITAANALERFHDAQQAREEALTLFNVGHLSLEHRALADRLYWAICLEIRALLGQLDPLPEELAELPQTMADLYFVNMSIFQSLPDSWAIDQVFPMMPIHRLDEKPDRRGTLADITCDSDGKVNRFVDYQDVAASLPLHALQPGEPYYLAAFLIGAYQETLGDLHNLFGDTHVVHVGIGEDGGWEARAFVEGDSVEEVLGYLQYEPRKLYEAVRWDCERSVRAGRMTVADSRTLLKTYERGLEGYTYLE